jgi:membrane-anchored glycerophosphoryl diester phosphodiesterase (GDPDase)
MSFEIIQEKKPAYPKTAMILILLLSILLLGAGSAFAYFLLFVHGNDYLWGTLLACQFLIAGIEIVLFARYFVTFREVSEDREEELLW